MSKDIRKVTYPIGVDVVGQPLYNTHIIEERKQKYNNKTKLIARSKTHR